MKVDFEFSTTIFAHELLNPPSPSIGSNVDLKILDGNQLNLSKIEIENKFTRPPRTPYDLKIINPLAIGFTSSERSKLFGEAKNLVLAMNLSLCRTCILDAAVQFSSPRIQFKAVNQKNEVRRIGNILHAFSENVVVVSDESFAWTSMSEYINENIVLDLFRIIQKFKVANINHNPSFTNLTKAITEYERSMMEYSRPFIFKHLFNSLEFCTNCNKEYISDEFDTAVSMSVSIPSESVRE